MQIRAAVQQDLPVLVQWMEAIVDHVQTTSQDPYVTNIASDHSQTFRPWLKGLLQSGQGKIFILDTTQQAAGFILGTLSSPFLKSSTIKQIGQIDLCWIEPHLRRQGMARQLCAALEGWFKAQGVQYVDLQYVLGNTEAETCWARLGYEPYRIAARKQLT